MKSYSFRQIYIFVLVILNDFHGQGSECQSYCGPQSIVNISLMKNEIKKQLFVDFRQRFNFSEWTKNNFFRRNLNITD